MAEEARAICAWEAEGGRNAIADPVRNGAVGGCVSVRFAAEICGDGIFELVADEIVL